MIDPIDPLPPVSTPQTENPPPAPPAPPLVPPKSNKKILVIAVLFVFLFVIFSVGTVTVLAAYEKITLPGTLQYGAIALVQSLPFTPKTPKYILGKSLLKLKDLKTFNFDFSFSTKVAGFTDYLGTDTFDIVLKGPVDLIDIKNPKFGVNAKAGSDFEGDLAFNTSKTYFRFVKVPLKPLGVFSLTESDISPLLNQWVEATSSANFVESQAKSKLDQFSGQKTPQEILNEQAVAKIISEEIFSKIKMDSKTLDSHPSYHLFLSLTSSDIKRILTKINTVSQADKHLTVDQISTYSNLVENILMESWIDSASNDLLEISLSSTIKVPSDLNTPTQVLGISTTYLASSSAVPQNNFLKQDSVTFATVLKLSNHNKPVTIDFPKNAISVEEFTQKIENLLTKTQTSSSQIGSPLLILPSIKIALDDYYSANSKYPRNFEELGQGLPKYALDDATRSQINDAKIVFKTSKDQSEVLLYSFTPIVDPANSSISHYSAIHFKNGQSITLSLTQEGLINQIKMF